jgi:hypothetical protein
VFGKLQLCVIVSGDKNVIANYNNECLQYSIARKELLHAHATYGLRS